MTTWDIRAFARALAATFVGLLVVWLVTAASDEGQLTVAVRAGRTLPLAPLCGAIGAALALGTARSRQEARALEALGRPPTTTSRAAALGAAAPSIVVAIAIATSTAVDVSGFYPKAARGDGFVDEGGAFVSHALGVRVGASGEPEAIAADAAVADDGLPPRARGSAAAATGLAGAALAFVAAEAALRPSLADRRRRQRAWTLAAVSVLLCVVLTIVAFQAAAAHLVPAPLAIVPPSLLLLSIAFRRRGAPAS